MSHYSLEINLDSFIFGTLSGVEEGNSHSAMPFVCKKFPHDRESSDVKEPETSLDRGEVNNIQFFAT
ncbi:hypothetical protein C7B65_22000 [Phormidesmis priestleyi ULC007]|uniref:Uncharacterized protein n=1 Tax=Phormidesmis priestleyi ULC007 TaxID=1920490 RepID=A0A2T1D713_9CYAN|nr:hypothetical protein C7B65_22000 [Phormidesmis priestleyi ULC007]